MDKHAVLRFKQNIRIGITRDGLPQVGIDHLHLAIVSLAEYLHILQFGILCSVACQEDGVTKISGAIRDVIARVADLARDRNNRRIFEIKTAKDPDGVKRLESQIGILPRQRIIKIERNNLRLVVRSAQANDLGMLLVGFWQKIAVIVNQVGDFHSITVSVFSGPKNMPIQKNGFVGEGKNG